MDRLGADPPSGLKLITAHESYGVTRDGTVWTSVRSRHWRELIATPDGRGYPKVKLTHGKTIMVHILVAQAFLGERPAGLTIDHLDGDKWNRGADNLEYVTQEENNRRAWRRGQQRGGWDTRRSRLAIMGIARFGQSGRYPLPPARIE